MIIIRYIKDCRPKLIWYPPQHVLQHLISVIRSPPPVSAPAVICCYAAASLTTNIDNYVRETVYVNGRGLVPFGVLLLTPLPPAIQCDDIELAFDFSSFINSDKKIINCAARRYLWCDRFSRASRASATIIYAVLQ